MDRMSAEYQRKVDEFVRNNVNCNMSMVITEFMNASHETNTLNEYYDDLYALSGRYDDDNEFVEVYEHWSVDNWFGKYLEEHGEIVVFNFMGHCIWGRTTTGQSISIDSVVCDIYDSLNR